MFTVEFEGEYHEASTINGAVEWAAQLIADDAPGLDGVSVEEDQLTNTWYVQGVSDGRKVGATAIINGPDAGAPPPAARAGETGPANAARFGKDLEFDGWARLVVISGTSPADAFRDAARWLQHMPESIRITAVRPINRRESPRFALEIYFRDVTDD